MTEATEPFELDVEWRPIAPEARFVWFAIWAAAIGVVGLVLTVATAVAAGLAVALVGPVMALAAIAVTWRVVERRYRAWGYALRDRDLVLRRGLLIRRLTIVPFGRIQFVDVAQGPLDRFWKIANLQLHTAAAESDAKIPLLPVDHAAALRDQLTALGEAASGV